MGISGPLCPAHAFLLEEYFFPPGNEVITPSNLPGEGAACEDTREDTRAFADAATLTDSSLSPLAVRGDASYTSSLTAPSSRPPGPCLTSAPCGGAGDRLPPVGHIQTASFDCKRFFEERKRSKLSEQPFFQALHHNLTSKGIGCMISGELWEELEGIYGAAEVLLFSPEKGRPPFEESIPFLYTHKLNPSLPRSFMLWKSGDEVYVTIFLNRHNISEAGGVMRGDERFSADCREKKMSYGLYFPLFHVGLEEHVLLISHMHKAWSGDFSNEYKIYQALPKIRQLASIYMGIDKYDSRSRRKKTIYVMPCYEYDVHKLIINSLGRTGFDHTPLITRMFKQIAGALADLHDHNKVHRDVKLENIFVRDDPRGIDFFLGDLEFVVAVEEAIKGIKVGTSGYFSPARWKKLNTPPSEDDFKVDFKAADVWALAVTVLAAYAMSSPFLTLTGKPEDLSALDQKSLDAKMAYLFVADCFLPVNQNIKALLYNMFNIHDAVRPTMRQVSDQITALAPDA